MEVYYTLTVDRRVVYFESITNIVMNNYTYIITLNNRYIPILTSELKYAHKAIVAEYDLSSLNSI